MLLALYTSDLVSVRPKMNCLVVQETVSNVAEQIPPRQTLACLDAGREPVALGRLHVVVLVEPPAVVVDVMVGKGDVDDSLLACVAMIPPTIPPTVAIVTNTTTAMATATMIHLRFDSRFCFEEPSGLYFRRKFSPFGAVAGPLK